MKQEIANTIANILLNVDSSRVRHPSLHRRKEGWTEVWGVEDDESPMSQPKKQTAQSKPTLIITQFDISHAEQLVLRIGNVPHVVRNSTYMVTEATGPLPYITDLSSSSTSPPSLVGRHHPDKTLSTTTPPKGHNHIISYLKQNKLIDHLDRHLTPEQRSQSILYENIIIHTLEPLLARALRDENSERIRARHAAGLTTRSIMINFQYEAMRYSRRSSSVDDRASPSESGCFLTTAMKDIYSAFNVVLESHSTLLGTETATIVDALLYDHLAKACRHVDWLLLLNNECGHLLKFYKRLYDEYFSEIRTTGTEEWRMRNDEANRENAYYIAPDQLSVTNVVVPVAKQKPLAGTTFHRVRYGGDIWLSDDGDDIEFYGVLSGHYRRRRKEAASSDDKKTSMMSKLKKDDQHYDTLWMGFVLAGIAMAFMSTNRNTGASV